MTKRALPWVEKYRPHSLHEVTSHEHAVRTIQRLMASGEMPNLLLHGPPGTGKTSTVLALANELHGANGARAWVLELNASDERGIDVVREKIKTFVSNGAPGSVWVAPKAVASETAHKVVATETAPPFSPAAGAARSGAGLRPVAGAPGSGAALGPAAGAPGSGAGASAAERRKVVVLDECDALTGPAQMALRRMMEEHARAAIFCLVANAVNKLIPALQSRCARFRFPPVDAPAVRAHVSKIATAESLEVDEAAAGALAEVAEGDLRRVINTMQTLALTDRRLTAERVFAASPEHLTASNKHCLAAHLLESAAASGSPRTPPSASPASGSSPSRALPPWCPSWHSAQERVFALHAAALAPSTPPAARAPSTPPAARAPSTPPAARAPSTPDTMLAHAAPRESKAGATPAPRAAAAGALEEAAPVDVPEGGASWDEVDLSLLLPMLAERELHLSLGSAEPLQLAALDAGLRLALAN
jgi:DNA polymerase III delta prime subunit